MNETRQPLAALALIAVIGACRSSPPTQTATGTSTGAAGRSGAGDNDAAADQDRGASRPSVESPSSARPRSWPGSLASSESPPSPASPAQDPGMPQWLVRARPGAAVNATPTHWSRHE